MNNTTMSFIKGLIILEKYEYSNMSAEYDVIYCGPRDPSLVSEEDKKELISLGFHIDDSVQSWAWFT